MASINAENLTFVDVSEDKWGSFVKPENLDNFLATPVGEAQASSIREEMAEQMAAQGVDDYEVTEAQIRRALFSEQAQQDYGRAPDVTNQQMLDDHGPDWLDKIGGALTGLFEDATKAADEVLQPIEPDPQRSMYGIAESPSVKALNEMGL